MEFRLFLIAANGRMFATGSFACPNHQEAIAFARTKIPEGGGIELWCGDVKIAAFGEPHKPPPANYGF